MVIGLAQLLAVTVQCEPTITAALGIARDGPVRSGSTDARHPWPHALAAGPLRSRRTVRLPAMARRQARIVRRFRWLPKLRLQHRNAVQQRQDQRVFLLLGQARKVGPRHGEVDPHSNPQCKIVGRVRQKLYIQGSGPSLSQPREQLHRDDSDRKILF